MTEWFQICWFYEKIISSYPSEVKKMIKTYHKTFQLKTDVAITSYFEVTPLIIQLLTKTVTIYMIKISIL